MFLLETKALCCISVQEASLFIPPTKIHIVPKKGVSLPSNLKNLGTVRNPEVGQIMNDLSVEHHWTYLLG